jgi:hypothetical protein
VAYQITGARDRVLLVRALNSKRQPLQSSFSSSSGFLFGDGVSRQTAYAGVVDRLEVVFAADEEAMELPFTLTDFALMGSAKPGFLDQIPPFRPYSYQALQREYARSGRGSTGLEPFELSPPYKKCHSKVSRGSDFRSGMIHKWLIYVVYKGRSKDGWEAGIRTPITCSRGRCPTVGRPPSTSQRSEGGKFRL